MGLKVETGGTSKYHSVAFLSHLTTLNIIITLETYRLVLHVLLLICHFKFKAQVIYRNLVASSKILHCP